jgi:hypothetical protein
MAGPKKGSQGQESTHPPPTTTFPDILYALTHTSFGVTLLYAQWHVRAVLVTLGVELHDKRSAAAGAEAAVICLLRTKPHDPTAVS